MNHRRFFTVDSADGELQTHAKIWSKICCARAARGTRLICSYMWLRSWTWVVYLLALEQRLFAVFIIFTSHFDCWAQNTERFSVTSVCCQSLSSRNLSVRLGDVVNVSSYLRVTVAPSMFTVVIALGRRLWWRMDQSSFHHPPHALVQ